MKSLKINKEDTDTLVCSKCRRLIRGTEGDSGVSVSGHFLVPVSWKSGHELIRAEKLTR